MIFSARQARSGGQETTASGGPAVAARVAMQRHLTAALEGLLIASEARAVAEVRQALAAKRDRTAHLKI